MEFNSVTDGSIRPNSEEPAHFLSLCFPFFSPPVSHSQVSPQCQEVLMENVTRMSEHSRTAQNTVGEGPSTEADLLENIWKLENLFQNHSEWLQRLEILIRVRERWARRDRKRRRCWMFSLHRAWSWSWGTFRYTPTSLRATWCSWMTGCPLWAPLLRGTYPAWFQRCLEPPPGCTTKTSSSGAHWGKTGKPHFGKVSLHSSVKTTGCLPGTPLGSWADSERTWMRLTGPWELSTTPSAATLAFTGWRYTTFRSVLQRRGTLRGGYPAVNALSVVQIQISNITEDTSSLWVTHVHTEAQLRNEMDILNTITEDLRLKDWEHSLALKNVTILEGRLRYTSVFEMSHYGEKKTNFIKKNNTKHTNCATNCDAAFTEEHFLKSVNSVPSKVA